MTDNLTTQSPSTTSPLPKHPTTESRHHTSIQTHTYPRTHVQAAARIRHHWQAREYAAAADYAALAHTLAVEAGDVALAAKYAHARQLAHKYQALKVEMQKINWQVAVDPILEPDDPPSSEARCNMVCKPDRPEQFQQNPLPEDTHLHDETRTPILEPSSVPVAQQRGFPQTFPGRTSGEHIPVNRSQPISRYDEPRPAPPEMDIDGTVCCFPISWAPWRRKR